MTLAVDRSPSELQVELERVTGCNLDGCLQCGCCAGGCTSIEFMDYSPRQVIQLVKLGYRDVVLKSRAIWVCASCHICEDRCPAGINLSLLMDGLRQMAVREFAGSGGRPEYFHRIFLDQVKLSGRQHEGLLAVRFSRGTSSPLPSARVMFGLLLKGRVELRLPWRGGKNFRTMVKKLSARRGEGNV